MLKRFLIEKLKKKYFPTIKDTALNNWREDGGDYVLRFNYALNERSIVIDLGGYDGQWSSDLFSRYCCNIHIFEPVEIYARKISSRFFLNNKINVYHYALGSSDKKEKRHARGQMERAGWQARAGGVA